MSTFEILKPDKHGKTMAMASRKTHPKPPEHLTKDSKRLWNLVLKEYVLEDHHCRILRLACEAWDRGQEARESLKKAGSLTFTDRYGSPRARPEVNIARDARIGFARLLREMNLDIEPPEDSRLPRGGRYAN